ncbi:MAG: acyl-CoA desaturase [Chitinophagia bacterium]|nr:acyl-CoA desaturase [Chitinophagia bacterium]
MAKVSFDNRNNQFYQSLKLSVDEYFETNGIKRTGDWRLYIKTITLIGAAIAMYCGLIFFPVTPLLALLICALMGFTFASIGFSVMHDANHGSYSTKSWLNDLIGLSANALGASSFFWKQKHNIIHHTYTNVDGIDDDIAKSPIIRQCETQKWVPAHKVQHLYLVPVYALSSIFWLFFMDFTKYFTRKIYTTEAWKMTTKNHVIFWATKICYFVFYMIIPMIVWGFGPWLLGFFLLHVVMGLTLSLVFQLAHVVENTEFENVALDETKHIETAWAEHQIKTSSNFSMDNRVISWFVGGLNFQIEHHLFPKVSHIHYPAISKIVIEKCAEFNLPYNNYSTITGAIASHFRVMRMLGKQPSVVETLQAQAA